MTIYLCRKYLVIMLIVTAGFCALPVLIAGMPLREAFPQALFFSGFVGAYLTYRDLRVRHIWPLYDNLRISRFVLLTALALSNAIVSVALISWLN